MSRTYPKKQLTSEQRKQQRLETIFNVVLGNQGKWIHLTRYCITKHQARRVIEQVEDMLKLSGIPHRRADYKIKVL